MEVRNGSTSFSIQQSWLNPIHNKFVIKTAVKSLEGGRKWWLTYYPAGHSIYRKDVFILILHLTGGPALVDARIYMKETFNSYSRTVNIKDNDKQATLLFLTHDELKAPDIPEKIEFEVIFCFKWNEDMDTESLPPAVSSSLSGQLILTKAEVKVAKIGDCRSTPKFDVPDIPGLQWWLDCYPNGNSGKQAKTLMIFLRVSMAPVNVQLTYSINSTKTVISGKKTERITRPGALRDIVQLKHDNPKFKDAFVNGTLTFVCVPSFTMPTKKVVHPPLSVATNSVAGSTPPLNSQKPLSVSIDKAKADGPIETSVTANPASRLSAEIVLTEVDLLSTAMGTCISTAKSDVPNIPGLQWWLDFYPNGDSALQAKTVMIFLRVSAAPVTVEVKYAVKNTDIENTKTLTFTRLETKFCVVQLRNDSPIFKSGFVNGAITFMFFPTFSHVHQSPSTSAPLFIPKTVTDSCTLPLYATEFFPANIGKLKSTPKRSLPDVPGLQWWLECYPAGNTPKDPIRRMVIFVRASVTPIKMTVTYHIPGTSIYRQLTDTIRSESSQGFSHNVRHDKIFSEEIFKSGSISLKCNVTITVPETLIRQQLVSSLVAKLAAPVQTTSPTSNVTVLTPNAARRLFTVKPTVLVQDSTFIVLSCNLDFHPTRALKPITTPKRRVNGIPSLEWWLEIFPAGNSAKQTKTFIAFVRVSTVPVSVKAVYSFAGTDITRQIHFKYTSVGARGANVTVSHATLTAANAFTKGNATFQCTVTFNLTEDQQSLVPKPIKPELPKASTTPLVEELPVPSTVPSSSKVPVEPESTGDRTPPESSITQPRVSNMLKFYMSKDYVLNPDYTITTPKRQFENGIQWFVTCFADKMFDDGRWRLSIDLNISTKVSGNVSYEVEGMNLRGTSDFKNTSVVLITQLYDHYFEYFEFTKDKAFVNVVVNLTDSSQFIPPTALSGSAESDSSEWTSTDDEEEDLESGMTDKELLLHRLKMQEDETNKVLELLKKSKPIMIADGEDFL